MALILACGPGAVWSQSATANTGAIAPAVTPRAGFEIGGISIFGEYTSSSLPNNSGSLPTVGSNLPWDADGGGSIEFHFLKFSERTTFSLSYTPSYFARWRYSNLDTFNHAFAMNYSHNITPRVTIGFSAAADVSSFEQSLFSPSTLSTVASTPSTFEDLSAAIVSNKFANNPMLGIALTNSPLVQSPLGALLYGERMLTASATASLSRSISPRLSMTFTGTGARTQNVSENQAVPQANLFLIPATTTESAGVALSYSLSAVSQLSASVTTIHSDARLLESETTTSLVTLGRTLGTRWVVQGHAGVGYTNVMRESLIVPTTSPRPAFGGTLAYKTLSQTFLGSYDRITTDGYGIGASSTSSASFTWRWRRPAAAWWLEASGSWQELTGTPFASLTGWHVSAGLSRALGPRAVLLTQYVYSNYSGSYLTSSYHSSQNAVRLALTWMPFAVLPH